VNNPSFIALISVGSAIVKTMAKERKGRERLTESDVPRVIPAQGEIPHHTPQVINSEIPPSSLHLTCIIQTPNLLQLTAELFTEQFPESIPVVANSSGKDNKVRVERASVFELQPSLGELLDGGVILESNLSVDNHLTSPDVYESGQRQEKLRCTK